MKTKEKQPWSVNQIENAKPNVPTTMNVLSGHIGNSMNGGHNKTIEYKKVMAGEKHAKFILDADFKILTPKTPPYMQLKLTIRSYFVPNSRIWENAEKYTAQRGGATENKIKEIPNTGGYQMPYTFAYLDNPDPSNPEETQWAVNIQNTEFWKKNIYSSYIPRMKEFATADADYQGFEMPAISILKMRGRKAIYNDFERNKEYDDEIEEFKTDTVSQAEWDSYFATAETIRLMRAKKPDNYYTNVRTELQGFDENAPDLTDPSIALLTWADFESKAAETRSQAENAQRNVWDIIAQIRGSKKLTEGKTQLIGERTYNLNYSTITQSSYNSADVNEEYQIMGQQGAYSYTHIQDEIYGGMIFNEEGYVHIIATVWAETVYEKGIDRNELNITPMDEYRPDLKDEKKDVLYLIEQETNANPSQYGQIIGFKRKFSEYFFLPTCISGDMTNDNYMAMVQRGNNVNIDQRIQIETNSTYQLYEQSGNIFRDKGTGKSYRINFWQDYTDLIINKNLAIKQEILQSKIDGTNIDYTEVVGQDQVFFAGKVYCVAELPIDGAITENYTKWGEH